MRFVSRPIFEADVLDPYPWRSPDQARAAWASHDTPTVKVTDPVSQARFAAILSGLSPATRTEVVAALKAAEAKDGKFAHLNDVPTEQWAVVRSARAANAIMAAAAASRGENFDPATKIMGPPQDAPRATARGIIEAGKARRGEV